jgi:hypothetical protein
MLRSHRNFCFLLGIQNKNRSQLLTKFWPYTSVCVTSVGFYMVIWVKLTKIIFRKLKTDPGIRPTIPEITITPLNTLCDSNLILSLFSLHARCRAQQLQIEVYYVVSWSIGISTDFESKRSDNAKSQCRAFQSVITEIFIIVIAC